MLWLMLTSYLMGAGGSAAPWPRVLLPTQNGAVALDGSPAALYLRPGVGANASNVVLFFEGGGWCETLLDCADRAGTALGSSNFSTDGYAARDLLQANCIVNPYFCGWSAVYAQYLDGTSRAGDVTEPVTVNTTATIYFRGHRILRETLSALLSPSGPGAGVPSLSAAPRLLITGSSAGGLTSFLHADEIARAVRAVNAGCDVRVLPEVGFFLNGESIWSGQRLMTGVFTSIANFSNVTGGDPGQVNAACVAARPAALRWQCFMAQYTLPHLTTPSFVVNSMADEWQTSNILAPNPTYVKALSPYAPFQRCIKAPTVVASATCNATQAEQWVGASVHERRHNYRCCARLFLPSFLFLPSAPAFPGYSAQFLRGLDEARAAVPAPVAAVSGGVITSCPIHTTLIGGFSWRIKVEGKTLYEHITAWMDGVRSGWVIDSPYPSNPTCPRPQELTAFDEYAPLKGACKQEGV